jgi:hypothetical protein
MPFTYRYYAVAVAMGATQDGNMMPVYEESVFLDVAIESLCNEQRPKSDKRQDSSPTPQPLLLFVLSILSICTKEEAARLSVFENACRMLCCLCFQKPWWQKLAGCAGLQILISCIPVSSLLRSELHITRSLLAVWKESANDEVVLTAEKAYLTMAALFRRCHSRDAASRTEASAVDVKRETDAVIIKDENSMAVDPEIKKEPDGASGSAVVPTPAAGGEAAPADSATTDPEQGSLKEVLNFLSQELASPSVTVRSNVQKVLGELREITGINTADLLTPCKATVLAQLFKRRINSFPPAVQIAHMDAVTYCISLRPPFLVGEAGLAELFKDTLALVEMEDAQVLRHPHDAQAVGQLQLLRTHCVQLLRTAMASQEVNLSTTNPDLRNQIILMFFKIITKVSV